MMNKRPKDWGSKIKGTMQLFKSGKLIREYKFHNVYHRRRMLDIWNAEVKPNGIDTYELIIKLE
jgi:hypothetical protein